MTIRHGDATAATPRQGVRLLASTPVYAETTGDLFGVVVVEMNLLNRLVQFLNRVEQDTAAIFITDADGTVWISDDPQNGVDVKTRDVSVADIIPETARFIDDNDQHRGSDRTSGWIASRVALDPADPKTNVGVILKLWGSD
jgi:hypothetical protein